MGVTETLHAVAVPCGTVTVRACTPNDPKAKNKTPVVYLHGGPGGCHDGGYRALSALATERPFYFYDQLGSYGSPCAYSDDLIKLPRFVEELDCIRKAMGHDKIIILGHSWGGALAVEYACNHPCHTSGLILSSPLLSTPRWIADARKLLAALPQDIQDTIRTHEAAGTTHTPEYSAACDVFYKRHLCRLDPWPEALLESFKKTNKQIYMAMWGPSEFSCTGTLKNFDRFDDLKTLPMPTLIMGGRYDEATPETLAKAASIMPDAKCHIFENSAHATHTEEPENYRKTVQDFLSAIPDNEG